MLITGFMLYILVINAIQNNYYPKSKVICEPKLSKYNLYNPLRKNKYQKKSYDSTITDPIINILSYADGKNSLLDISDKTVREREAGLHTFDFLNIDATDYLIITYSVTDNNYHLSAFEIS